jgi:hypothetical protein
MSLPFGLLPPEKIEAIKEGLDPPVWASNTFPRGTFSGCVAGTFAKLASTGCVVVNKPDVSGGRLAAVITEVEFEAISGGKRP